MTTLSPDQFGEHYRYDDPPAKTEEERLQQQRFDASFAFELNHPSAKRSETRRPSY